MVLACNNINKSFGANTILKNINFQIEEKEKVAVVGVNGAGKSTLFKILAGKLSCDSGEIFKPKEITIGYLSQDTKINNNNTIFEEMLTVFSPLIKMENELRSMEKQMSILKGKELSKLMQQYSILQQEFEEKNGYGFKSQIHGVLKGLGFNQKQFNQPINQLSGGQKTRVSLAKLLLSNPSILLLDEPTNHLDISAIEWLEDFLKNYSGTIMIISHDRYFLDKISSKVIEIENNTAFVYNGNYSFYAKHKKINREIQIKQYLLQEKEIKRQKEIIKTLRSFNREKSIKRAKSREKALEKIEKIEKPKSLPSPMKLTLEPKIKSGYDVLHVENISKSFGDKKIFENISFDLKKGDKVALIGPNGVGKTTLFKILLNQIPHDSGTFSLGTNVKIGYYDQEHQNISHDKSIIDEISDAYPNLSFGEIRNILAAFLFTGDDVFKKISTLSGGEKGRVSLAKIMLSEGNFLLLDEPTNHLEIISKEVLEDALNNYTGTVLYISHDRYFINKTANKILELNSNGITEYMGNYDYYIEKRNQIKLNTLEQNINKKEKSKSSKEDWLRKKEEQARQKKIKSQIEKIENKIQQIEDEIKKADEKLCLEEVYSDPKKSQEVYEIKLSLEEELDKLYAEWDKLNSYL
ncbi:ABC-F family ATP-binding cassette domain-containing protein [Defluviitalea phaphyphila]|uniref:ABC-F family ATP-binding cassette domain-containing protein n=1 Tax=Defluviitalea phaphyphila TaxID=1473580 RepID=UPI000731D02B|nr:ABC-F family ATP-binding cassette domain-containing protein [Defluviitalea phaphyphila]